MELPQTQVMRELRNKKKMLCQEIRGHQGTVRKKRRKSRTACDRELYCGCTIFTYLIGGWLAPHKYTWVYRLPANASFFRGVNDSWRSSAIERGVFALKDWYLGRQIENIDNELQRYRNEMHED